MHSKDSNLLVSLSLRNTDYATIMAAISTLIDLVRARSNCLDYLELAALPEIRLCYSLFTYNFSLL